MGSSNTEVMFLPLRSKSDALAVDVELRHIAVRRPSGQHWTSCLQKSRCSCHEFHGSCYGLIMNSSYETRLDG